MHDELRRHVGTGRKLRLERSFPSNPRLNGYLLEASDTLGLIHCFHDFMPDGFAVFRIGDISTIRSGKYERHWDRMLKEEGLLSALAMPPAVDLASMRSAIESISARYKGMIIECEGAEEDCEDFYIGSMLSINDYQVCFEHFDGLGNWEDTPSSVPLGDISLILFDTPYIQTFWKYVSGQSRQDTTDQ
jgi:hypothetical protein